MKKSAIDFEERASAISETRNLLEPSLPRAFIFFAFSSILCTFPNIFCSFSVRIEASLFLIALTIFQAIFRHTHTYYIGTCIIRLKTERIDQSMHWPLRSSPPSSCYPAQLRGSPPKTGRIICIQYKMYILFAIIRGTCLMKVCTRSFFSLSDKTEPSSMVSSSLGGGDSNELK